MGPGDHLSKHSKKSRLQKSRQERGGSSLAVIGNAGARTSALTKAAAMKVVTGGTLFEDEFDAGWKERTFQI